MRELLSYANVKLYLFRVEYITLVFRDNSILILATSQDRSARQQQKRVNTLKWQPELRSGEYLKLLTLIQADHLNCSKNM